MPSKVTMAGREAASGKGPRALAAIEVDTFTSGTQWQIQRRTDCAAREWPEATGDQVT